MISELFSSLIIDMKRLIKRLANKKVSSTNFFLFLIILLSLSVIFDTWAMVLFIAVWMIKEILGAWRTRGYNEEH